MAANPSLSDLCTICYTEKPKYRCPRCKIQTCSLACSKRHKQRASCSGERDPAAYVKRNQLATPAGLDQDYNYLKKIERTIDRASQDSQELHGGKARASTRNAARGWQPDSSLQKYLVENRIQVERAPKGLSRQQTNQTRPTKSKRIVWTVEWIDRAGKRELQHDCLESESLGSLHRLHQVEKRNAAKKRASTSGSVEASPKPAKRKKNEAPPQQQGITSNEVLAALESSTAKAGDGKVPEITTVDDDVLRGSNDGVHHLEPAATDPAPVTDQFNTDASSDPKQYFYLLRPATATSSRVLIPLDEKATLTACLRDHTVQEYPTIFILPDPPESIPEGYVLEDEYLRTRREEEAELQALESRHAAPTGDASGVQDEPLDAKGILDMLKRDVRA